ncbi:MAG TPA: threonine synthase [Trueperaceae bacterium]
MAGAPERIRAAGVPRDPGPVGFRSSRGEAGRSVPFRVALLQGLAPDGGLYLPESIPPLPERWHSIESFPDLATELLGGWLEEPTGDELARLIADALDFPVPLVELSEDRYVVELFHGPTLSFKDFGARTMARLMNRYLEGRGERLTILVATSGDTGSAVADGFSGLDNLRVVLLYPKGMVSEVQERQLIAERPNLTSLRVRGTFDDCQRLVKGAFVDPALEGVPLSSANSINVGRLLPQQCYYVWAVAELVRSTGSDREPLVAVPSGNLGNLTAGLLAAAAGLPVNRFLAAHNANDFFPRFLAGAAQAYRFGETVRTISNAMDVGSPSNFERLDRLFGVSMTERISATSVSDQATRERMRATFEEDGYIACPHTAVGFEAVERYRAGTGDRRPALVLATAHPAKFPDVVAQATGVSAPSSELLERLRDAPQRVQEIEAEASSLRQVLLDGQR